MNDARIVFFGSPTFATHILNELADAGIVPTLIVTVPDKPAGRGLELTPPAVKVWASDHGVEYIQPTDFKNDSALDVLINSEWDLFIVAAYGKILPENVLNLPHKGTLNVHPSLLPKFRGASPIESQILTGELPIGVSIMLLDSEMDHGPVLAQAEITPDPWPMKATELETLLAREGGTLLAEAIPPYLKGEISATEQDHTQATFTKKIEKADGEIDLAGDGYQNYLKFCAYDGWPGVFFFKDGKRVKIVDATYADGIFTPTRIIPEGKKEIPYLDFFRGG